MKPRRLLRQDGLSCIDTILTAMIHFISTTVINLQVVSAMTSNNINIYIYINLCRYIPETKQESNYYIYIQSFKFVLK